MADFSINEMQEMQQALQDKYKDRWEPICPETGQNKMLWMVGEIGEVIDIVKKHGAVNALTQEEKIWLRKWQMFLCTTMMSCSVTELRQMN